MFHSPKILNAAETAKTLTRAQMDALRAIAHFRRQRKVGRGWLVGDKHVSEKIICRLELLDLVEESYVGGKPVLQLTIIGQAMKVQLLQ